ncbi:MAG: dihydrofolate reductase [Hamadaea sp.]|nr:dihydrofolate reductase [Hamadaea sp.]
MRIVAFEHLTLDGVMQGPGSPDEDRRGGFTLGGWAAIDDPEIGRKAGEGMAGTEGVLLGRQTYEDFHSFWPHQTDGNQFTAFLDKTTKYVVSTTLTEPLPWQNSTLLRDPVAGVAALRDRPGESVVLLGSGQLLRALLAHDLVDELQLMIHPVVLGTGRRLFADDEHVARWRLAGAETTTSGVVMTTYRPAAR